jgi:hypothetical protein
MALDANSWLRENGANALRATLRIKNISKTTENNSSKTTESLPLPLPSDVVLRSGGTSKKALAFYSSDRELAVDITGQPDEIDVNPGETIELLYYIPTFQGEATIEVAGVGTTTVKAP